MREGTCIKPISCLLVAALGTVAAGMIITCSSPEKLPPPATTPEQAPLPREEAPEAPIPAEKNSAEELTLSSPALEASRGYGETILTYSARDKVPIKMLLFNSGPTPPVLVFASIHGDELEAARLSQLLETRWTGDPSLLGRQLVWFVPCVNPDGVKRRTRQNGQGVDLNRNFPASWKEKKIKDMTYPGPNKLSEPEAKALYDLIESLPPRLIISLHSCRRCGGMNNYDGPAEEYAAEMSKFNGYKYSPEWHTDTPGSFGTYAGQTKKIPVITLEMPVGMTESDYSKNIQAVEAAIKFNPPKEKRDTIIPPGGGN